MLINLELQKQVLKKLDYSDFEIKEILEEMTNEASLDEYGAFLDEGDEC